MSETTFQDHTVDSAPQAARAALAGAAKAFGFLPSALARMAESPTLVEAFNSMLRLFDRSSLAPLEREVLVMTLAREIGCDVCVALHTATLHRMDADPELVAALRAQTPLADPRLEALRRFVSAVLVRRGDVDDAALAAFLAAGFARQAALDVVLGIGTYTLSMFANRLTRAPIDAPFERFRLETA